MMHLSVLLCTWVVEVAPFAPHGSSLSLLGIFECRVANGCLALSV